MVAQLLSPFRHNQSNGRGPLPASVLKISTDVYKNGRGAASIPGRSRNPVCQIWKFGNFRLGQGVRQDLTPISPRHAAGGAKPPRSLSQKYLYMSTMHKKKNPPGKIDLFRIHIQVDTMLPCTPCTSQQLHNMRKKNMLDLISLQRSTSYVGYMTNRMKLLRAALNQEKHTAVWNCHI